MFTHLYGRRAPALAGSEKKVGGSARLGKTGRMARCGKHARGATRAEHEMVRGRGSAGGPIASVLSQGETAAGSEAGDTGGG